MFPQLFRMDGFFLPTYGLLVALGFLSALWLTARLSRKAGLNTDAVLNLGIYTAIAGMAGAKLFLLVLDAGYYAKHPGGLFSFATLQAGGIFYGGLIAALLVAAWYMRRARLPGLATADAFAPGVALGHAIGRVGCFAAGCCWGVVCDRPWAVTFTNPESHRLVGVPLGLPLHPTQLYEAFAEAAICLVLYRRFVRPHRPGAIIGLYLMLYSLVRFAVEFFRAHDANNLGFGPFSTEQWIALALAAVGAWLAFRKSPLRQAEKPAPAPQVRV